MATYDELLLAAEHPALTNKIRAACFIAADVIRTEVNTTPNHANRLLWAKAVFQNPGAEAQRMVWTVLAQNRDATLEQITGATDAAVQAAVEAAVDVFAIGS